MTVQCHDGQLVGVFGKADAGNVSIRIQRKFHCAGDVRFDIISAYLDFGIRISGFRILVGIFTRIVLQSINVGCLSGKYRKRIGRYCRFIKTDVSDLRIISTEFQRTVKTEFFFIHPVWDTVDNRVLFTVFGNLAFTIAIKQFHKKDIVIADKSYHCSVRRKDGDLLRSAVRQPLNNVVCRNALIISFQRVDVMYSCI